MKLVFSIFMLAASSVVAQGYNQQPLPGYSGGQFYQPGGYAPAPYSQPSSSGQSIMFQNNPGQGYQGSYDHLTTMPRSQTFGDRCQQMARDIESLRGKPQRRYSLMQRYKAECELK